MPRVHRGLVDIFRRLAAGKAPWPLYLHGPAGSGKTCAALALCDFADTAGYWTVESLCDQQLAGQADWEAVANKALAVLDELGERERPGDLHHTVVKRFLDAREIHAGRMGIYISNLKPSDLSKLYDDRVCSRVLCGARFELQDEDRRKAK